MAAARIIRSNMQHYYTRIIQTMSCLLDTVFWLQPVAMWDFSYCVLATSDHEGSVPIIFWSCSRARPYLNRIVWTDILFMVCLGHT